MKYILLISLTALLSSCENNKEFKLKKVIFHSSYCFGSCPSYHLQIDDKRNVKFFSETVYKANSAYEEDTSRMGYFVGSIDIKSYNKIDSLIKNIGIDTLNFGHYNCCDGSKKTLIVYHNWRRIYLKSMFPPQKTDNLLNELYQICERNKLKRTNKTFKIEE